MVFDITGEVRRRASALRGSKRVVDQVYRGFSIRAFESSPGKWKAEIRKADGSSIQILLPELEDDVLDCLTTDPETVTAEAAILLAKEAIDGGGMR